MTPEQEMEERAQSYSTEFEEEAVPLTCPDCDGEADDRVRAGMKCAKCAYPGGPQ